jgi:hypothetical protein
VVDQIPFKVVQMVDLVVEWLLQERLVLEALEPLVKVTTVVQEI